MGVKLRLHLHVNRRRLGARGLAALLAAVALASLALYSYKTLSSEAVYIESYSELKSRINSQARVAVMFSSPTCHVCEKMLPHWLRLARAGRSLNVSLYVVQLGPRTARAFQEYGVTATPTFILYSRGRPVAVHVGEFTGVNVTQAMLEWILSPAPSLPIPSAPGTSYTCTGASCAVAPRQPPAPGLAAALFATSLLAGVLASLSPCTLPLLIAHASASTARGRRAAAGCFAASLAAVTATGAAFAASSLAAASLSRALTPLLASTLLALGAAQAAGYTLELPAAPAGRLGVYGRCGLFGLLSVQCSLPLVAGPFLLVAGIGLSDPGSALAAALGYAVGLSSVLAAVAAGSTRLSSLLQRALAEERAVNAAGGALLIAAGALLAAYYLGLV